MGTWAARSVNFPPFVPRAKVTAECDAPLSMVNLHGLYFACTVAGASAPGIRHRICAG